MDISKPESLLKKIIGHLAYERYHIEPEWVGGRRLVFNVDTDHRDMPLLIGKQARTIRAIQTVFRMIAKVLKLDQATVNILGESSSERAKRNGKAGWKDEIAIDLISELMECMNMDVVHLRRENRDKCVAYVVQPAPEEPILIAMNTIVESVGRSYGQRIGLFPE